MKKIDQHIFSEWFVSFLLSIGVTTGLLLMEDMYDDLSDILGYGASTADILRYYIILFPSFLPTVIPLSLILSVLFSLGKLHRDNEIIAMRMCGMSLFRITRSLWISGLLLAIGLFYLNAQLVPWSVETSRSIWDSYEFNHELKGKSEEDVGLVHNLTFYNRKDRRLWFFNRFSEYSYEGFGITVSMLDEVSREQRRILANEGYFDDLGNKWIFKKGREVTFDVATGTPIRSLSFEDRSFPEFSEEPMLMMSLKKRPKDLSLFELADILEKVSVVENERLNAYTVRYHRILTNPLDCLIVLGIAVPFSVLGVRANPLVGMSKALGLFFFFYFFSALTGLLGERGIGDPLIAAWMPTTLMVGVALFFYRKAK